MEKIMELGNTLVLPYDTPKVQEACICTPSCNLQESIETGVTHFPQLAGLKECMHKGIECLKSK